MNRKNFKILSKRQMQRIVKKKTNLLIQKAFQSNNENDTLFKRSSLNASTFFSQAALANPAQDASVSVGQAPSLTASPLTATATYTSCR